MGDVPEQCLVETEKRKPGKQIHPGPAEKKEPVRSRGIKTRGEEIEYRTSQPGKEGQNIDADATGQRCQVRFATRLFLDFIRHAASPFRFSSGCSDTDRYPSGYPVPSPAVSAVSSTSNRMRQIGREG